MVRSGLLLGAANYARAGITQTRMTQPYFRKPEEI